MLYLEELVDSVIAEEGQTLMGLDFLFEALELPMKKIELIFKKALYEYSERRPMKKTKVVETYDPEFGIKMPEGTTSCRIARYGVMANQMPRFLLNTLGDTRVEFDPTDLTLKVFPPAAPLRLTYTQRYIPTRTVLIQNTITLPYETDEVDFTLPASFAKNSLKIQKAVTITDPNTGEKKSVIHEMSPVKYEEDEDIYGNKTEQCILEGTLGTGTVDLNTREVNLQLNDSEVGSILYSFYPKYYVVEEMDLGNRVFNMLFSYRLLTALASLRAQATQEKLHNVDLTSDDLYGRVAELRRHVIEVSRNTISFGDIAPV